PGVGYLTTRWTARTYYGGNVQFPGWRSLMRFVRPSLAGGALLAVVLATAAGPPAAPPQAAGPGMVAAAHPVAAAAGARMLARGGHAVDPPVAPAAPPRLPQP